MTLLERIDARIAELDTAISRTRENARLAEADATAEKSDLQQVRLFVLARPEVESLLAKVQARGLL